MNLGTEPDLGQEEITLRDITLIVAEHGKLLIAGPILAGLIALGLFWTETPQYFSETFLAPVTEQERSIKNWMKLPIVLNDVAAEFPAAASSPQILAGKISWRNDGDIVVMRVSDPRPETAQAIGSALIKKWLEVAKPGPELTASNNEQINLLDEQLKEVTNLMARLSNEATQLADPGGRSELATSLASLLDQKFELMARKAELQKRLKGPSPDIVLVPATLPTENVIPSKVKRALASAAGTGVVLILFIFFTAVFRSMGKDVVATARRGSILKSLTFWRTE